MDVFGLMVLFDGIYGILKNADAEGGGLVHPFTSTSGDLFIPGPARMISWMVQGFRMGHEAEDPAGGITYAGNIMY